MPENPVDGKNVWDIITGKPRAKSPHEYYPLSTNKNLDGVISGDGRWKLHLPHQYRTLMEAGKDGMAGKYENRQIELSLFDMKEDPNETTNVLDRHPKVAGKLKHLADRHRKKFYSE